MSLKMKLGIGMSNQLLHASASLHVCMCWISFVRFLYNFPTIDFIFFFVVKNCASITEFQLCLVLFLSLSFFNLLDSLLISFLFLSELCQFPFHFGHVVSSSNPCI